MKSAEIERKKEIEYLEERLITKLYLLGVDADIRAIVADYLNRSYNMGVFSGYGEGYEEGYEDGTKSRLQGHSDV